jgi:hypothetical protein
MKVSELRDGGQFLQQPEHGLKRDIRGLSIE